MLLLSCGSRRRRWGPKKEGYDDDEIGEDDILLIDDECRCRRSVFDPVTPAVKAEVLRITTARVAIIIISTIHPPSYLLLKIVIWCGEDFCCTKIRSMLRIYGSPLDREGCQPPTSASNIILARGSVSSLVDTSFLVDVVETIRRCERVG